MLNKKTYPYNKLSFLVDMLDIAFKTEMENEGWLITPAPVESADNKYISDDRYGDYWQVQRRDEYEDESGNPIFPILPDDYAAQEIAKSHGIMLDDDGILLGFRGKNYIKEGLLEEISFIKRMMLINENLNPLEKYKEDKNYGYGEGKSPMLPTAQKIALNNAKIDYSKKNNIEELENIKIIEDKTFREPDNQYKKIIVITVDSDNE